MRLLFRKIADILFLWAEPIIFEIDLLLERIREDRRISGVHVVAVASGEVIGWCDIVPQPIIGDRRGGDAKSGGDKIVVLCEREAAALTETQLLA